MDSPFGEAVDADDLVPYQEGSKPVGDLGLNKYRATHEFGNAPDLGRSLKDRLVSGEITEETIKATYKLYEIMEKELHTKGGFTDFKRVIYRAKSMEPVEVIFAEGHPVYRVDEFWSYLPNGNLLIEINAQPILDGRILTEPEVVSTEFVQ